MRCFVNIGYNALSIATFVDRAAEAACAVKRRRASSRSSS